MVEGYLLPGTYYVYHTNRTIIELTLSLPYSQSHTINQWLTLLVPLSRTQKSVLQIRMIL